LFLERDIVITVDSWANECPQNACIGKGASLLNKSASGVGLAKESRSKIFSEL